ncbi:MAG: 50S ribosomal protein L21 [Nannocystis sp.]|nr:50S ribosomal protein L21 [Nannocystis sp.]
MRICRRGGRRRGCGGSRRSSAEGKRSAPRHELFRLFGALRGRWPALCGSRRLTARPTSINSPLPRPGGLHDRAAAACFRAAARTGGSSQRSEIIVSEQANAVIRTGGKQYRVSLGEQLNIEKLPQEVGASLDFDVLLLHKGESIKVGTPSVSGAKVHAEVVEHGRGRKLIVFKYKPRTNYRKKRGHRQAYTRIKITEIVG